MNVSLPAVALLVLLSTPAASSPTAVGGVDHVGLTATDLDASAGFFTDALGFELSGRDDDYPAVFLTNGEIIVTLWRATEPGRAIAQEKDRIRRRTVKQAPRLLSGLRPATGRASDGVAPRAPRPVGW